MAVLLQDQFPGSAGANLTTDTSATTWTTFTGASGWAIDGQGGAYPTVDNTIMNAVRSSLTLTGDVDVTYQLKHLTADAGSTVMGVLVRGNPGDPYNAANGYWFTWYEPSSNFQIFRLINGTNAASWASGNMSSIFPVGSTATVQVICRDNLKAILVNGVVVVSTTDNTLTIAGGYTTFSVAGSGGSATTGTRLQNLLVQDSAVASNNPPPTGTLTPATTQPATLKYWKDGAPLAAQIRTANDPRTLRYWQDGQPANFITGAAVTESSSFSPATVETSANATQPYPSTTLQFSTSTYNGSPMVFMAVADTGGVKIYQATGPSYSTWSLIGTATTWTTAPQSLYVLKDGDTMHVFTGEIKHYRYDWSGSGWSLGATSTVDAGSSDTAPVTSVKDSQGRIWLVAGGHQFSLGFYSYYSTDNGATWTAGPTSASLGVAGWLNTLLTVGDYLYWFWGVSGTLNVWRLPINPIGSWAAVTSTADGSGGGIPNGQTGAVGTDGRIYFVESGSTGGPAFPARLYVFDPTSQTFAYPFIEFGFGTQDAQPLVTALSDGTVVVAWSPALQNATNRAVLYSQFDPTSRSFSQQYWAVPSTRGLSPVSLASSGANTVLLGYRDGNSPYNVKTTLLTFPSGTSGAGSPPAAESGSSPTIYSTGLSTGSTNYLASPFQGVTYRQFVVGPGDTLAVLLEDISYYYVYTAPAPYTTWTLLTKWANAGNSRGLSLTLNPNGTDFHVITDSGTVAQALCHRRFTWNAASGTWDGSGTYGAGVDYTYEQNIQALAGQANAASWAVWGNFDGLGRLWVYLLNGLDLQAYLSTDGAATTANWTYQGNLRPSGSAMNAQQYGINCIGNYQYIVATGVGASDFSVFRRSINNNGSGGIDSTWVSATVPYPVYNWNGNGGAFDDGNGSALLTMGAGWFGYNAQNGPIGTGLWPTTSATPMRLGGPSNGLATDVEYNGQVVALGNGDRYLVWVTDGQFAGGGMSKAGDGILYAKYLSSTPSWSQQGSLLSDTVRRIQYIEAQPSKVNNQKFYVLYQTGNASSTGASPYATPYALNVLAVDFTPSGGGSGTTWYGTAAGAGQAALSSAIRAIWAATGSVLGHAAVTPTAAKKAAGSSTVVGQGAVSVTGAKKASGAATIPGIGAVSAVLAKKAAGVAAITGLGAISASLAKKAAGRATIPGVGAVSASVRALFAGKATSVGQATITSTSHRTAGSAAFIAGMASTLVTGAKKAAGSATIDGLASLSATLTRQGSGAVTATAQGLATVNATIHALFAGHATSAGQATVAPAVKRTAGSAALIQGLGAVNANVRRTAGSVVTIHGQAAIVALLGVRRVLTATSAGRASTSAMAAAWLVMNATSAGIASMTSTLAKKAAGSSTIAGRAVVSASGAAHMAARAVSVGQASIYAGFNHLYFLVATIVGHAALSATAAAQRSLAATSQGRATVSSSVTFHAALSAVLAGAANLTAALRRTANVTAHSTGQATVTSSLGVRRVIAAVLGGVATATSTATAQRNLIAHAVGQATTQATGAAQRNLATTIHGLAVMTGRTANHAGAAATALGTGSATANGVRVAIASAVLQGLATFLANTGTILFHISAASVMRSHMTGITTRRSHMTGSTRIR